MFRTNHGITLTEAGKVLYKHAKGIMDYSQRAIQEARLAAEAAATTFCVGTLHPQPLQALHGPVVPGE